MTLQFPTYLAREVLLGHYNLIYTLDLDKCNNQDITIGKENNINIVRVSNTLIYADKIQAPDYFSFPEHEVDDTSNYIINSDLFVQKDLTIEQLELSNVRYLVFGSCCKYDIQNIDLKNVTKLQICGGQLVEKLNLKNVTHLRFGHFFNQPVEKIDLKSVTHLSFGWSFNRPIEQLDLKNVTHLSFGHLFNRSIEQLDLKNVTHLSFESNFTQYYGCLHKFEKIELLTMDYNSNIDYQAIIDSGIHGFKLMVFNFSITIFKKPKAQMKRAKN